MKDTKTEQKRTKKITINTENKNKNNITNVCKNDVKNDYTNDVPTTGTETMIDNLVLTEKLNLLTYKRTRGKKKISRTKEEKQNRMLRRNKKKMRGMK